MGFLITHKLTMQHKTNDDQKKKKSIIFKAALEMSNESEDECFSNDNIEDKDIAMVVRCNSPNFLFLFFIK